MNAGWREVMRWQHSSFPRCFALLACLSASACSRTDRDGGAAQPPRHSTTHGEAGAGFESGASTEARPPVDEGADDRRPVDASLRESRSPCTAGTVRCKGNAITRCKADGEWGAPVLCGAETPYCIGSECVGAVPPSCRELPPICGPKHDQNCCSSSTVTGGTYYRSYDGILYTSQDSPATVSDFRLDDYEITVGRFRAFVSQYEDNPHWDGGTGGIFEDGAGKNPNDPMDPGWQDYIYGDWLPRNADALRESLKCNDRIHRESGYYTWTDTPGDNENRPINCITWVEAYAFCIWDGGRLPTEAEWNYAAAGGSEQRRFPWGEEEPGSDTRLAIYDCWYQGSGPGSCSGAENIAPVGWASGGNGKWGQANLAGNLMEWLVDGFPNAWAGGEPYATPCIDCAAPPTYNEDSRALRGGSFDSSDLEVSRRGGDDPKHRTTTAGARCAR